jgi:uncharacterized protein (TIGR02246 family)
MMGVMNLRGTIIALGIVATAPPGVVMAQVVADPATLHEIVERYQNAMGTHDPTVVAAFFSEDADLVPGNLPALHGRAAIEAWWRTYFEREDPERRGTFDVTSTRFLTPDVALVNLAITSGGVGIGNEVLTVRKARGTWLLRRHDNQWLIEAVRILPTEKDRVELVPSLEAAESLRPQLRSFVAAYEDAYDRHDPGALTAFYRHDADIIVRNSPVIQGMQAIREFWRAYFSQPRPFRVLLIVDEIRMMSDNVALLSLTATGATSEASDQLLPVRRARATWVVVRENGAWLIAALRVFPSEDDRVIREHEQGR